MIKGFGSFSRSERVARMGRNPRTGEPLAIPASKYPSFRWVGGCTRCWSGAQRGRLVQQQQQQAGAVMRGGLTPAVFASPLSAAKGFKDAVKP